MHSVTDRQTDGQTDDRIAPIADRIAKNTDSNAIEKENSDAKT